MAVFSFITAQPAKSRKPQPPTDFTAIKSQNNVVQSKPLPENSYPENQSLAPIITLKLRNRGWSRATVDAVRKALDQKFPLSSACSALRGPGPGTRALLHGNRPPDRPRLPNDIPASSSCRAGRGRGLPPRPSTPQLPGWEAAGAHLRRLLKCAVRKARDSSGRVERNPPGKIRSSR
jgi:hypothetical protein